MHHQFLRTKKLTGKGIIEVAARHNHREILAELGAAPDGHIDPARVELNCLLRGHSTATAVAGEAQSLMDAAGIKSLRKDAVRGIEVIFGLPPESRVDHDRFFNESVQWASQYFAAPVISAIVHNDESAPHCHVLLLPLVNGRMIGSALVGGRAKMQAMQADFQTQVGQRYGLARQTAQKRISAATRKRAIDSLFDVLQANSGLSDAVLRALLAPHSSDPAPLLLAMGMAMPTSPAKGSFVEMMTKPCKPEKPIGFGKKKPIGLHGSAAPENDQTLSCVGFAEITPSDPPPNEPTSVSQGTTVNPQPTSASTASSTTSTTSNRLARIASAIGTPWSTRLASTTLASGASSTPGTRTVEPSHRGASREHYDAAMTSSRPTPLTPDRANTPLAHLIEAALDVLDREGARAAAALLTDADASFATIGCVLCDPSRRRLAAHQRQHHSAKPGDFGHHARRPCPIQASSSQIDFAKRRKTPKERAPPVPQTPLIARTALFGSNLKEHQMAEQIRSALLRRKEVEVEVALARSAIRRRISAGTFPRPVSLGGPLCVRWRREDIDAWIANPSDYRAPEAA